VGQAQVKDPAEFKRLCVAASVLVAAAIVVFAFLLPAQGHVAGTSASRLAALPDDIGNWKKTRVITFNDSVIKILGTDDVTSCEYTDGTGRQVTLVLVRALNNRSAFHPPEYCLTGGGNNLLDKSVQKVSLPQLSSVNEMRLSAQNNSEFLVWNWYGANGVMTAGFYKQQWLLLTGQLARRHGEGLVANLYTNLDHGDIARARGVCRDFAAALMPHLIKGVGNR
jgi:EpsI family protein